MIALGAGRGSSTTCCRISVILSQRQEGSHRQAIPGPFCLQVSARLHSGHPGPGIAPEKNPGTRAPSSATARLQRLPWSSTLALPRSEF